MTRKRGALLIVSAIVVGLGLVVWARQFGEVAGEINRGHFAQAKVLTLLGADVNRRCRWESDSPRRDGPNPLTAAIQKERPDVVRLLLRRGANPNGTADGMLTPLQVAVGEDLASVKLLLSYGANANRSAAFGSPPILLCSWPDVEEKIEALLAAGADVSAANRRGTTLLDIAAGYGHLPVIKLALQHGARMNVRDSSGVSPLDSAVYSRHRKAADLLISKGAEVDLWAAAGLNDMKAVERLLAGGEPVSHLNGSGTPLHYAAANGRGDMAAFLISKHADPNSRDDEGRAPLHIAARCASDTSTAAALLSHGAVVDAADKYGMTPLMMAASNGNLGVAKLLLSHGASIKRTDKQGGTALHLSRDAQIAELLLASGARIEARGYWGRTPLLSAAWAGNADVADVLISHGAALEATDENNTTPLATAARNCNKRMVELLLRRGADPNCRSVTDRSVLSQAERDAQDPLDKAQGRAAAEIVRMLKEHGAKE